MEQQYFMCIHDQAPLKDYSNFPSLYSVHIAKSVLGGMYLPSLTMFWGKCVCTCVCVCVCTCVVWHMCRLGIGMGEESMI